MDINLLSKMVGELILDHERVSLPGVGTFVAIDMPASFSDRGYTINPPYRKMSFTADKSDDSLLAALYAVSNGVEIDAAKLVISGFLSEMLEQLRATKTLTFPGLGRLRATRDNTLFFVSDEELDIYPDGFGLAPISLKTHASQPSEEQAQAMPLVAESVPELVLEATDEPAKDSAGEEKSPEPVAWYMTENDNRMEDSGDGSIPIFWKTVIWLLVIAAVFFGTVYFLGHFAPSILDPLLYSTEELEIINFNG